MSRRRAPLPSSLRWRVFTAAEARAAGVSGSRLLAGDLLRIDHGLYALSGDPADPAGSSPRPAVTTPGGSDGTFPRAERSTPASLTGTFPRSGVPMPDGAGAPGPSGAVDDPTTDRDGPWTNGDMPSTGVPCPVREADVIKALQRADPLALACGLSAARLWKMPLPLELAGWDAGVPGAQITMNRSGIHRLSKGLVAWRSCDLAPTDLARVKGVLATSRLRTLLDLAEVLPHDDLVAIGDHLVRIPRPSVEQGRTQPYVEFSLLAETVRRFRGRGARRLRSVMEDVRVGADSAAETELRLALLRAGLPEPLLNTTIHQDGKWLGDPDLSWRAWKVCVEYDGRHHRTRGQQAKDIRRGERRRLAGWTELIITVEDMDHGAERAIQRVRSELRRRGMDG